MGSKLCFAAADTLVPAAQWLQCPDDERLARVRSALADSMLNLDDKLVVTSAKSDGQVIVRLQQPLSASQRGTLLLDLEAFLKEAVDPGLTVWVEALGDKNSLRNLRGIEVKA